MAGAHARAAVDRMDSDNQENVGDRANVGASGGKDCGPRPSRHVSGIFWSTRQPCNDQYACHGTATKWEFKCYGNTSEVGLS